MSEHTVTLDADRYDRLAGMAAARGRSVDEQLAALIDDACDGAAADATTDELPLGVCDGSEK